jgi:hypothetical protein
VVVISVAAAAEAAASERGVLILISHSRWSPLYRGENYRPDVLYTYTHTPRRERGGRQG